MSKKETITLWNVPVECLGGIQEVLMGELTDAVQEANWSYARRITTALKDLAMEMEEGEQNELV